MRVQLVDRNATDDYTFVGGCGELVTINADKVLKQLERLGAGAATGLFAVPRFDAARTAVMWFTDRQGPIRPFTELSDAEQEAFLETLEDQAARIREVLPALEAGETRADVKVYARLMPLLFNFPLPVEYHLFAVGETPVVTNWGMNKSVENEPRDTLTPFIAAWRSRLGLKRRQEQERQQQADRESSFIGRLTRAGARSGAVTVSLMWNDVNDLDLHVLCPDGTHISFENKQGCGGILDVDRNAHPAALTVEPVENVVWTAPPTVPGRYEFGVHHFRRHDPSSSATAFTMRLVHRGKTTFYEGRVVPGQFVSVGAFTI